MRFFSRKKLLISSAALCVISVSAFFLVHRAVGENQKAAEKAREDWREEEKRRGSVRSLAEFLSEKQSEKETLYEHFARSSDIVPLLSEVELLAAASGGRAEVATVSAAEDGSSLSIDLKAEGSFEALYKLMTLLENSKYEFRFLSADLQAKEEEENAGDKAGSWSASFQLAVLSFIK